MESFSQELSSPCDVSQEIASLDKELSNSSNTESRDFNTLFLKGQRIHAGFLFYRDKIKSDVVPQLCSSIYVTLVRRVGATKENAFNRGWKDLGYELGLVSEELNYIDNATKGCPTDLMFKVFAQDENSTFGKIVEALFKIERLDILEGIFDPLQELAEILIDRHRNEQDYGYYSMSIEGNELIVVRPKFLANNLPEVLQWNKKKHKETDFNNETLSLDDKGFKNIHPLDSMPVVQRPAILLTYSDDGVTAARNIFHKLSSCLPTKSVNVITLENDKLNTLTNPEQYIRHYFEEVDYVIPILTEGYMEVVKSPTSVVSSSFDNLDCTYARFIYTLMSMNYINGSGCLNKKVRALIPQNTDKKLLSQIFKFPILSVWVWEKDLDKLISTLF